MWPFKKKNIEAGTTVVSPPSPAQPAPITPVPPMVTDNSSSVTPHAPNAARVMITNGGPHPADLWAQVSAEHIAPISDNVTGDRRVKALALQSDIAKILTVHYKDIQELEQEALDDNPDHVLTELDHNPHIEAIVNDIQAVARGTEWEAHFTHDAVLALLDRELGVHIRTIKHIHRSWHLDRNPDHPHCEAFRSK